MIDFCVLFKYIFCKIEYMRKEEEIFEEYWEKTEVIREYHQMLFTFGDMRLPYVFVAEHASLSSVNYNFPSTTIISSLRLP